MPTVGLTGAFGTGKTYVASIFKKLGAKVIDADKLAHRALTKGSVTYKNIVKVFGKSILDPKGYINRKALGKIVFSDKKYLAKLERIVHPYVIKKIYDKMRLSQNEVLIIDAPLICETKLYGMMDTLVVVRASKRTQIDRCIKKFNMNESDVCKRMAHQMPLEEKLKKADYIVDNDGSKDETEKQVKKILQNIKKGEKVWR